MALVLALAGSELLRAQIDKNRRHFPRPPFGIAPGYLNQPQAFQVVAEVCAKNPGLQAQTAAP
jgi:hypothetical protein